MAIWDRKRKRRSRDAPDARDASVRKYPLWGVAPMTRAREDMRGNEAIYAAVSQISNMLACMPLHLYRHYEIQWDDPRERCVAWAPNPNLTPYGLKLAVEVSRNTMGTGYIMIVPRGDGITLDHLDPLVPERVKALRDAESGEIWYQITLDDGRTLVVHNCWIVALHHMSTDGVTSVSPVEVLGATLKYDRKVKEISLTQLDSMSDCVILTYPAQLSSELRQQRAEEFVAAYRASRGHVMVLDGGVTADRIQNSVIDPKVLDVNRMTRQNVASVYNLPPRMMGDASASGYSTSEQDLREFTIRTLLPIVKQWEEALNRKLLSYAEICEGYTFRFDMEALRRGDTEAMADRHQKLVRGATFTPNDARKENGLPALPYGDELLVSRDMLPLRVLVENPELLLAGETGSKGGES